jgi:alkanesulfonate monooxygenase SsuD/methylene tetrahydromethanopterin reductase-like flavin-dependent oxidoreductase (luciferase family)
MTAPTLRFGAFYDLRNPAAFRQDWTALYRETLDQVAWLDVDTNFSSVSVSEHHFTPDGYSASPLPLAMAIAGRTSRIGIVTNIVQLPLHHPLRIAEDALAVDILSGGRFRLGVANGYRVQEFEGLGTSTRFRRERMEEAIGIIRKAFAGEEFSHQGKHWSFPEIEVTPSNAPRSSPQLWMGGTSAPVFDRAARLADGFLASVDDEIVGYLEACERHGVPAERRRTCRTAWALVAEDPERALDALGPSMLHQVNGYVEWGFIDHALFEDAQELLDAGFFTLHDSADAIRYFTDRAEMGIQEIHLFAQIPGETVESGSERLKYVSEQVIPHFQGS